jgi:hypothetical protein
MPEIIEIVPYGPYASNGQRQPGRMALQNQHKHEPKDVSAYASLLVNYTVAEPREALQVCLEASDRPSGGTWRLVHTFEPVTKSPISRSPTGIAPGIVSLPTQTVDVALAPGDRFVRASWEFTGPLGPVTFGIDADAELRAP